MHHYLQSAALAAFVLAVFAVLGVFAYLISGLFGPRQVDELPQQYDEPTEEEFTSLE